MAKTPKKTRRGQRHDAAGRSVGPWVSEARIDVRHDGTYHLNRAGKLAKVVGIIDRNDGIADYVAWFPADPQHWWLRHGCHPLLGAPALAIAQYHHGTIRLHSTPAEWLAAALEDWQRITEGHYPPSPYLGFVVLNWGADIRECVEGVGAITCSSSTLQKRFRQTLRKWEPRVLVARPKMKYAA